MFNEALQGQAAQVAPARPRKRIRWKFKISQMVDHKLGGLPSVVIWRGATSEGDQIYGIVEADRRVRFISARVLVLA